MGWLGVIANGCRVYIGSDENALELTVMTVAQLYEYTKHYWIVYFKWVNCMVHKLYLNEKEY